MDENMELFSLEDEECSQLFITQESKSSVSSNIGENDGKVMDSMTNFLGMLPYDFTSPTKSLLIKDSVYSDISDAEDFNIPSSQQSKIR